MRQVGVLRLLRCPLAVMAMMMVLVLEEVMVLRRKDDGVWGMHLKGSGVHCDMRESKAGKGAFENFSKYIWNARGDTRGVLGVDSVDSQ